MRMNIKMSPKFHLFHRGNQNSNDWLPCLVSVLCILLSFCFWGLFEAVLASLRFRVVLPVRDTEDWLQVGPAGANGTSS